MGEHSALADLIGRGRRRQIAHLLIHSASFAAVLALGGSILLLVLGTQILNWYWLVLLFAGSLLAAAYRSRSQLLSRYQIAQSIDRQLGLQDALSTAFYFGEHPDRTVSPREFIERQRQVAEDLARSADVRQGVPFLTPRTLYVNAALVAVAFGMFGLRYGINRSLDLRPSLVRINFEGFLGGREVADAKRIRGQRPLDGRDPGAADTAESKPGDLNSADPSNTVDDSNLNNPDSGADPATKGTAKGNEPLPPGNDPLDPGGKGQTSPPLNDAGSPNASPDANSQSGKQQSGSKDSNPSAGSGDNSSLAEKMRDALANLLAKLKSQPQQGGGKSNEASQAGSQSAKKQGQSQDGESKSSPGQDQTDSNSEAQAQGDQQQGGSQQAAQGKSEGQSNNQPNSPDGKSGIGKQDGDKTAREAAELAAMGKISEIIGKRAANVTGEIMVEVASGKQQLKTQYSQRDASHADSGGEINRDEVPLAYQQYVQQYFAEIRKLPASKSKPADGKAKSSAN